MRPLEGFKVVEFATFVVAPTAARVLSDWGADVIKIEAAAGDPWRTTGAGYNLPIEDDCNPAYAVSNSGKRFVSLNLKTPEGKEALLRILSDADVFITNIRLAGIRRLGLDWETLHEMFPRLIYCHFTGYGYEGPDKDRPGFDGNAFWASSGTMHELHVPDGRPAPLLSAFGDTASSNAVVSGIVAALLHRERTGEGLRLTTSLYANGIWCNHARIVGAQPREDGSVPPPCPTPVAEPKNLFAHVYECSDGEWIALISGVTFTSNPARALRIVGLDAYTEDERFLHPPLSRENTRALYYLMEAAFKTKTSAEWDEILTKADISHQVLIHSRDVSSSEQAWANGYLTRMTCPNGSSYVIPNSPVTFFGVDLPPSRHPGPVGQDTSAVLAEYGYTEEEIQVLFDHGAAAGK